MDLYSARIHQLSGAQGALLPLLIRLIHHWMAQSLTAPSLVAGLTCFIVRVCLHDFLSWFLIVHSCGLSLNRQLSCTNSTNACPIMNLNDQIRAAKSSCEFESCLSGLLNWMVILFKSRDARVLLSTHKTKLNDDFEQRYISCETEWRHV